MITAVADTHAALWQVFGDRRLSMRAAAVFANAREAGNQIGISSLTFAEIVFLVERSRIPEDSLARLLLLVEDPARELIEIPFTSQIAEVMSRIPRQQVPDMPDRIIAATGLAYDVPLISRDSRIRASGIETIW